MATLLVATFLRVYAAGRRHLAHPLDGQDPEILRAIVEEQREKARAEDRSVRLFLEATHAEYAMPGSSEAFVRAFRRYPLDDLKEAERRFRAHACRCVVRVCDRYFAAVVRDVNERAARRRAVEREQRVADARARRARDAGAARAAELDAHPERRLFEALDVLADTWIPATSAFVADGQLARSWLRRAVVVFFLREPLRAVDCIEAYVRSWLAAQAQIPQPLCDAVRGVLGDVITDVQGGATTQTLRDLGVVPLDVESWWWSVEGSLRGP